MLYNIGYGVSIVLLLVSLIVAMSAQSKVTSTYNKYKSKPSSLDMTGAEFADKLAKENNLFITIKMCGGTLTDHYNPKDKSLNLSQENYQSKSISALAVVAHEFGHALQDENAYKPLFARQGIIVFSNLVSRMFLPLLILGLIIDLLTLGQFRVGSFIIYFAVVMYGLAVVMNVATLHVEKDASRRALTLLSGMGGVDESELTASKQVLDSAGLTYLASLFISVAYFLRFLLLLLGRRK